MGRPKKYTDEEVQEIVHLFEEYIDNTLIPIIAEFAYQNNIERHSLYDYEEFSTLIKRAIDKKEAQLEKLGLSNEVNQTMAIFSLKQLGWRDRHEVEHQGKIEHGVVLLPNQRSIDEWKKEHIVGTAAKTD